MKYYKTSEALRTYIAEDSFLNILVCIKDLDGIVTREGEHVIAGTVLSIWGNTGYVVTESGQILLVDLLEEVSKEEYKEYRKECKRLRDLGKIEGSYFVRN